MEGFDEPCGVRGDFGRGGECAMGFQPVEFADLGVVGVVAFVGCCKYLFSGDLSAAEGGLIFAVGVTLCMSFEACRDLGALRCLVCCWLFEVTTTGQWW
jgi:hypothetical protein